MQIGRRVENDLDRHALHDLDVVAGGVLGRQMAKAMPLPASKLST